MTSFLVRDAFERGATLAYLTTENPAAQTLYEKLGFRMAGDEIEYR